jgi:hypothetical protein
VFGEADAVEPPLAGERDQVIRVEGAASRERAGVAVEVDEHAGGYRGSFMP